MTKSINQPPNPKPEKTNPLKSLAGKLKSSPKTVAAGAVAIAALGSLAYWGTQVLVKKKLPPFLETQIGKIIERPIDLGEMKSFSLSSIEFGKTVIPPTATDPDRVEVEEVKVGFNVFPVLFRRTLPLDVSLVQPDVYLEQEKDGEWINLDFLKSDPNKEKKDPLIYFDVDLDVEQADITAVPYEQNPLMAQVDGSGRFHQKKELLEYDLDAGIEEAKAKIQGETKLKTGTTDTKLLVKDLALSDVATLLPNSPVELNSGTLNADLDINIPSFEEITAANVKGIVNLNNVAGEVEDLNSPVTAKSKLNFSGRNADVKETQATLGDITAQVDGKVNLDTGYDLNVEVLPFELASIPDGLTKQLPVDLSGEVEARVKVLGEIKNPQVTGKINNTQTVTVDQTSFKQVNADFRADLAQVVLENLQLTPLAGGSVTAQGTIETNLRQALSENQPLDAVKMPLAFTFQADLPTQELITPYYQLPQQVGIGNLSAKGKVKGTLDNPDAVVNWNIAEKSDGSLEDIAGAGKLTFANNNLALRDTKLTYGDGQADVEVDANLDNKKWQANLDAKDLNLTPFLSQVDNPNLNLDRPVTLETAQANFNGRLDQLDLAKIDGNADLNLNVDGGNVAVDSKLNAGNVQAKAVTTNIQLDQFITSLPVAASVQSGTLEANGKLQELLSLADNADLNSLELDADLNLEIDGEAVAVDSQINSGRVNLNANTSQINLNRVAPNLPIPAKIKSSQVNASGELKQLLNFGSNPNLSTVDARINADLTVANGTVNAIANLNNNQWQADVNANNLDSQLLLDNFAPKDYASVPLDNINAQANLSGNIQPVLNNDINVPVAINNFTADSGAQNINAKGDLTLSNVTSNLDIADTNLDVAANLDFDRLPIQQVVASATQNNDLVADSVNIAGKAAFNGQFNGQKLISAPTEPGNINLTGDLRLQNFAFNDIAFDPVMTGTVNVQPQEKIALNLQGENDVIAASAVPCQGSDCKLPYLPTNLELRQGEDTNQPVIATGNRNGDIFSLDINNFPLALLNLAPAQAAGIEGALGGKTTGNVDLNLNTLAANGNIAIQQPGVGYIQADRLNAQFNYDPVNNIAAVTSSSLDLGDSEYNLNAALDLQSGQINGKLDIPEAYIQDVLTTFRWFTIEDVISLFNIPDYASPAVVKPAPEKDTVDQSIARKLNQLRQINRQIQANAAARETASIPSQLDIDGRYEGEIVLGGTIQTPKANFKVEGNNWQWQPTEAYPNIVSPLGLVIEESQAISIPKLLIDGNLVGTTVDLDEATIKIQEALLSLKGELSTDQQDAEFAIANLTVDNIGNFVDIPVDLAGEINSIGTIKGTLENPRLAGKVAFTQGAFNGNILPAKLAGDFDYDGKELGFNTTAPDSIRVEANVPYPIIPGKSDLLTADAEIDKEAFVLLEPLSQRYLSWIGGEGNAKLKANARLDLEREGIIYDLDAQGVVNLEDANVAVETPFFSETFIGTGKITLDNQIVNVETLDATFAEKDLSIVGKLPILTVVKNLENPLTINLPKGEINIDKLYKGGLQGEVIVTGASLEPVIGGEVTLEDGKVSIPKTETPTQEDTVQIAKAKAVNTVSGSKALPKAQARDSKTAAKSSSFVTALKDFKVNLQDFKLEQTPVYKFQLEGGLLLNGTVDEPSNIIPKGRLMLTRADVDLFSTTFHVARNRENMIVFTPDAGVFNPNLDIVLKTEVTEVEENEIALAESGANEIPDPLSRANNADAITVFLNIMGDTEEILPNLGPQATNCNIRPVNAPLIENSKNYSEQELNRLTQCFNDATLLSGDNSQIINSPAVELTSIPSRSQGELISLFGKKFLAFAEQVANSSQSELFDLGVNQFVVAPIRRSVLYRVDDTIVGLGKKVGLDYLRVIPNFEGIVELDKNSAARSTYNYALQEVRLEYERRF